jgi:hypothetical protein
MPVASSPGVPFNLSRPGEWVLLEEVWKSGIWEDNNREIEIPLVTGVRVTVRHNFMWPWWVHEVTLGPGRHTFFIPDGWNKYQVRLDSGSPVTIMWIV